MTFGRVLLTVSIEVRVGRGVKPNKDHVYFHVERLHLRFPERLPSISAKAKTIAGVDVTEGLAPVLPIVRRNMGGILTSWKTQIARNNDSAGTIVLG